MSNIESNSCDGFYSTPDIVLPWINCQRWRLLNPYTVMLQWLWLGIFITNSIQGYMGSTCVWDRYNNLTMLLDRQDGTIALMCHISLLFNTQPIGSMCANLAQNLCLQTAAICHLACIFPVCNINSFILISWRLGACCWCCYITSQFFIITRCMIFIYLNTSFHLLISHFNIKHIIFK